ncbi:hypothetical protein LB565_20135 [Mesorhizobium sp. CA14]|uniref:hypothetical protein n=1 Tax=Mesorhizobium sp. CA14 TaxID=2876642 RepID=UPI001CCD9EAE|nr:hypothetical protein [Mesorhizobium sp. CA14]MBZ9850295.1 hypothetical protein [Mesorhizobium sp. CA14]
MAILNESARAFRQLITSEDYRRNLRKQLGLSVEPPLPTSFTELLGALDRRDEETDEASS